MEAKISPQLFGAFLMFLVLQPFVAKSRPVKLEQGQKGGCGILDIIGQPTSYGTEGTHSNNHGMFHLVDNYTFFNGKPKWENFPVTYGFRSSSSLPAGLDSQEAEDAIDAAFETWLAAVPKLAFQKVDPGDEANIKIAFTQVEGNYYGFGYAPPDGRLDLDNDHTNWSTNSNPAGNQLDLQSGALHEIGHTLGLDHSQYQNAVMYDTLYYGTIKRTLSQDDIDGIQDLYA